MDYKPDLSPEQKLNIVLQKVVNASRDDILHSVNLTPLVGADGYEKEIFEILLKLLKDGYVTSTNYSGHGNYVSNFDGRLFIDNGGYVAKALKDANDALLVQLEIDRRRTLDVLLATNSTRLNVLTWWLVIGAFAVVAWQIFLYFYPVHRDYPYWIWETIPKEKP
ncbi:hypothetical protein HK413_12250 [Mucilaginibacter sp. S1162]|uniref:Uncharacterized protein n=1 Tax=Mucilaginibacter humi TaxID=2732510 RepID=A0ABX1W470_9SPHI|nr:hypothetical protein [Mucilaginibacter humi]NNU34649.1 hypothetical protein [Mucilaginibacter humi]